MEEEANHFDQFDKEANHFDKFDEGGYDDDLSERWRLNSTEAFYRGTITGSLALKRLHDLASQDEKEAEREQKDLILESRSKYDSIVADLAAYDSLPWFKSGNEAVTSLAANVYGSMWSPESFLGVGAKGASLLVRTLKSGLQQGAITAAADVPIQALNITSNVQENYEPQRTGMAFGLGAVIGGGLHLATGELLPKLVVKKQADEWAAEDPAFRSEDTEPVPAQPEEPTPEPAPEPAPEPPPARAEPEVIKTQHSDDDLADLDKQLKAEKEALEQKTFDELPKNQKAAPAWTQVGPQKGSNPGGTYKDQDGADWYVKFPQTEDHVRNEVLANKLYELGGALVPELKMADIDGKGAVASKVIHNVKELGETKFIDDTFPEDAIAQIRRNFATDAWLANHDVAGLNFDNIVLNPSEPDFPYRLDTGGALLYRAQGEPKANFGNKVTEFDSMRDPSIAPQAAKIFGDMSDQELINSINRVLLIDQGDIRSIVDIWAPGDTVARDKLADTLIARQAHLSDIRKKLMQKQAADLQKAADAAEKADAKQKGLPPSKKKAKVPGKDLDITPAESLKRAKKSGFNMERTTDIPWGGTWYHAAKTKFEEFDLSFVGTGYGNKKEKAVFLGEHPHQAKKFGGHGSTVLSLVTRAKKVMVIDSTGHGYSGSFFGKKIQEAIAGGYDAVLFRKVSDLGGIADQLAVLKPNLIRNVNAKFEPKNIESAKLAAIMAPDPDKAAHNAKHLASLPPDVQAWHVKMGAVAQQQGFSEIGTAIVPGDKMFMHKMYRNEAGEILRFFPYHDNGEKIWEFQAANKKRIAGTGGPEEVSAFLSSRDDFDAQYQKMLDEAINDEVNARQSINPEQNIQALIRKKGQKLSNEQQGPDETKTTSPEDILSPEEENAVRSLQQQVLDLAKALDVPVHEGRVQLKKALATYNEQTGVIRTREIADAEAFFHEAGHHIEKKVGQELSDTIDNNAAELGLLDYNYPNEARPREGFAEWMRHYIGSPIGAQKSAPNFTREFLYLMEQKAPKVLEEIHGAVDAYKAWNDATPVDAVAAITRRTAENPKSPWGQTVKEFKDNGFFASVRGVMQASYRWIVDQKSPYFLAVREMTAIIKEHQGGLVDLPSADNPAVMATLFDRSHQAAQADIRDGVYRWNGGGDKSGPSLSAAVAMATGKKSDFGRYDPVLEKRFNEYLIAKMLVHRWDEYDQGLIPNPPAAIKRGVARKAMEDLEKAFPAFTKGADMVHQYNQALLRKAADAQLISHDLYMKLSAKPFYVPLFRSMVDKPLAKGDKSKGGAADAVADVTQRFTGSTRDIMNPIESIVMQTLLVNRAARHNEIIRLFLSLSDMAPGLGKYVERVSALEAKSYTFDIRDAVMKAAKLNKDNEDDLSVLAASMADVFGRDPILHNFFRLEKASKRGEPIVWYKEDGELKAARFIHKSEGLPLYETLTALPSKLSDVAIQTLSLSSSVLRIGVTRAPVYLISNFVRDQIMAFLARPDYIPFIDGLRGMVSEVRQDKFAKMYARGGGVAAGSSTMPANVIPSTKLSTLGKQSYVAQRFTSINAFLEFIQISESGTRNSIARKVYLKSKKAGMNDHEAMQEAVHQANDILPFGRWGDKTQALRAITPFWNVWAQGLSKLNRSTLRPLYRKAAGKVYTQQEEAEYRAAIPTTMKTVGLMGLGGAMYAAIMWDDENYRDAIPEAKAKNFVFSYNNKTAIAPKPFEWALFFTAGEYAYARFAQQDPRAAEQFREAVYETLKSPAMFLDNPLLKTVTEWYTGISSFTGRPVVPTDLQGKEPAEQYISRTSSPAKAFGKIFGVSPMKVDQAIGTMFGTIGRDFTAFLSGWEPDAPEKVLEDRAIYKRFVKSTGQTSEARVRFWEYMARNGGRYNQVVATYDDLVSNNKMGAAMHYLSRLKPSERLWVTMQSGGDEEGKMAFSPAERNLHPLKRALEAVKFINSMRSDLNENTLRLGEDRKLTKFNAAERRKLLEELDVLSLEETRNAFVIMKEPGYVGRPLIDVQVTMDKIKAVSPEIAKEVVDHYATKKLYKTKAVADAFPKVEREVLRNGSEADLGIIALDAETAGYEFGGERRKKTQKIRVPIAPQPYH